MPLEPIPTKIKNDRQRLVAQYQTKATGILHLGAHYGQERERYRELKKPVIWIEADPDSFKTLKCNIQPLTEQRALCALLGDRDGVTRDFHRSNNAFGVSSSIYPFGEYASGKASLWPDLNLHMVESVSLPSLTLDTVLRGNDVNANDYSFWVIDLQGAELLALAGAKNSLQGCDALLVEVSLVEVYQGGASWDDLRQFLEAQGFLPLWKPIRPHDDVLFVQQTHLHAARAAFQSEHYLRHNARRLEHLASLGLDLTERDVLEVGAGVGDHTSFYLDRGCNVVTAEARPENFNRLADRYRDDARVTAIQMDLDAPETLNRQFDIVHCYGLLYHLAEPDSALRFLSEHCAGVLLLESCVSFGDHDELNPVQEASDNPTQSVAGTGCRPTRAWIWNRLSEHFAHVYVPGTQPHHEEFPLDWTDASQFSSKRLTRAVFIASQAPLRSSQLLSFLPPRYSRF